MTASRTHFILFAPEVLCIAFPATAIEASDMSVTKSTNCIWVLKYTIVRRQGATGSEAMHRLSVEGS